MRHQDIEKLIDTLNAGELSDRVFRTALSETVEFARVWPPKSLSGAANKGSYPFYFIKDESGTYVGAVFDMGEDFHVFVKHEHRGKGHLCNALNGTILPYLFQQGRSVQKVNFESTQVADNFVRHLGFQLTGLLSAEKDLSVYAAAPKIELLRVGLSPAEVKAMKLDIDKAMLYLKMVKGRLETAYGDIDELWLEELIYDGVGKLYIEIDDFIGQRVTDCRDPLLD